MASLIYNQLMTPMWLKTNSTFMVNTKCNDVVLDVEEDTRMHEKVLEVPLVAPNILSKKDQLLVKINAGLEYDEDKWRPGLKRTDDLKRKADEDIVGKLNELIKRVNDLEKIAREIASLKNQIAAQRSEIARLWRRINDPLAMTISDSEHVMGIETRDPKDYQTKGPYRGVSGEYSERGLLSPKYIPSEKDKRFEPVKSTRWPQLFRIILCIAGKDSWGSCYSDIDGGDSLSVPLKWDYLDPSKGLNFVLFRGEFNENYHINYFQVSIYKS